MDPLFAGLMGGASSLISGVFSSNTNSNNIAMQRETNQMNIQENQKNRDFQEQMSNTAYQRASKDMTEAGLNPMMMFGSGSAASSPSGGVPNIQAPRGDPHAGMAQMGDAVGKAVSSAIGVKTFDKMTQEIANLRTQQALTSATIKTEAEKPELIKSQRFNVDTSTAREANRMPASRLEGASAEDILSMPDWLRRSLNVGEFAGSKAGNAVAPLLNSAGRVKSLFNDRFGHW